MNKFTKNFLLGGALAGTGYFAYQKLLTPYAKEQLSHLVSDVIEVANKLMKENKSNSAKQAKLILVSTLEKTESEWSRLGY